MSTPTAGFDPYAPPPTSPPPTSPPPRVPPRPSRLWPVEPEPPANPGTLVGALAVGVVAALTLRPQPAGSALLVTGVGVLAVALRARGTRPGRAQSAAVLVTVALLAVPLVRSAPWLVALALLGAGLVGSLALVGGWTWTGLTVAALSSGLVPARAARWVRGGLARVSLPGVRSGRAWAVLGATVALVGVFGALFAAADPAYSSLLRDAVHAVALPGLLPRLPVLVFVTAVTVVAAYLAQHPPRTDGLAPAAGRPVRRWEWVVPLAGLDLLFLSFVLVQLTVLFGGRGHVLATAGLTYADYARQGFWQLLVVTVLTLAVVAVATRTAPRATAPDRLVVRALLAVLCLLALAVVASALHRMSLYEREYGFTRLRLFVSAVELALGATFVLLLAAGVRLRGSWLPRSAVGLAALTLLALAVVDPDAYVAGRSVTRYEQTGHIDLAYLSTLSADAVSALDRLPADLRACALVRLAPALQDGDDAWYDVNLSRLQARRLLTERPVGPCRLTAATDPVLRD